jgi:hypothetical protein
MRFAVLLAIILGSIAPVSGGELVITSPDHARTFAYGEMISRQLYFEPTNGVLVARITFSNLPYVSDNDPRADESFDFRFPGMQIDRANQAIWAPARHGKQLVVAQIQGGSNCGSVEFTVGAKIYLLKESGRITAVLTATDHPRSGLRWIQRDDNWSLQNLVAGVFRRTRS